MVYNPEIFTDNSAISTGPSMTIKNTSARKSLCIFTEVFYAKKKTSVHQVGAAKSKRKAIRAGSMLWSSIQKRRRYKK